MFACCNGLTAYAWLHLSARVCGRWEGLKRMWAARGCAPDPPHHCSVGFVLVFDLVSVCAFGCPCALCPGYARALSILVPLGRDRAPPSTTGALHELTRRVAALPTPAEFCLDDEVRPGWDDFLKEARVVASGDPHHGEQVVTYLRRWASAQGRDGRGEGHPGGAKLSGRGSGFRA
jgi:hypothetical protein